jgi:D-lactate dehydrogenase
MQPDARLVSDLSRLLAPERVLARPIDRLGRSGDASIYRLIPEVVVRPRDAAEVRALLAYATAERRHLTFRAAGTSLSGQAVSDDILVELGPFWKQSRVLDGGRRVWAQPGVVGGYLNRLLAPLRARIGPDPASIDAAMLGGILANNASGMCCGIVENSYRTLDSLSLLLADGTDIDGSRPDADTALRRARPDLHEALGALRDEIRADGALAARVCNRFARKNTTGYSLNAFLDFEAPSEILAHLMIGSQGTLGFVSGATLRTVPEPPFRATALLYFARLVDAGAAVQPLAAAGAAALEIMDAASLRSQAAERRYPFAIEEDTAALLVELRAGEAAGLDAAIRRAKEAVSGYALLAPESFTTDPAEREHHWKLRKGLFPSVGAMRPSGTSVVIEDVAFPVERLAEAITDLKALFRRHGFPDTIVFGHAKDGNLHFVLAEDFGSREAVARYGRFMQALVDLVVGKYDGALKAEHGSGRNMAPFVRTEWGDRAYAVMQRVKGLLDPQGILNPGVVLSDDPEAHLRHLKPLPSIAPLADRCIECGFCEPRCPSRDLSLSPRQRIVVTRELARLAASSGEEAGVIRESLLADYAYEGLATCAGDSMCETSCPVKIDTGALVKEVKAAAHSPFTRSAAAWLARHFGLVTIGARVALHAARALRAVPGGAALLHGVTAVMHRQLPWLVPAVPPALELPAAAPALPAPKRAGGERHVVYMPSCLTRMLGALPGEKAIPPARALLDVLEAQGFSVRYPEGVDGLCCGMPFASKALPEAAETRAALTAEALWTASRGGRDPVVIDASPCAGTLAELVVARLAQQGRVLRVLDFPAFWAGEVLPGLASPPRRAGTAVLHPTCTLVKAGGVPSLLAVAQAHAEHVVLPAAAECCGFAGDRGFLVPELTRSATAGEAREVRGTAPEGAGYYSTCRTCEIGMSRGVGRAYRSLVHLVHEALFGA